MTEKQQIAEGGESLAFLYLPDIVPTGAFLPEGGDPVAAAMDFLSRIPGLPPRSKEFSQQNVEEAFEILMERLGLVLVVMDEGEVSVFSTVKKSKLPPRALKRMRARMGVLEDTPVGWFRSLNAEPVSTYASEALYGKVLKLAKSSTLPPLGQRRTLARKKFWSGSDVTEHIVDELLK
jgi:hypothetical protein